MEVDSDEKYIIFLINILLIEQRNLSISWGPRAVLSEVSIRF